jgi:hypothetical protein
MAKGSLGAKVQPEVSGVMARKMADGKRHHRHSTKHRKKSKKASHRPAGKKGNV